MTHKYTGTRYSYMLHAYINEWYMDNANMISEQSTSHGLLNHTGYTSMSITSRTPRKSTWKINIYIISYMQWSLFMWTPLCKYKYKATKVVLQNASFNLISILKNYGMFLYKSTKFSTLQLLIFAAKFVNLSFF